MNNYSNDTTARKPSAVRDRLLLAAAQLLHEAEGKDVPTRAICELAGVQAPTLYHHFGNKQGLLDAVVNYGFTQYVQAAQPADSATDPVAALRAGWDHHVQFGLDHPAFYVRLYGQIQPGVPCTLTAVAETRLRELLTAAARQGRLRVPPEDAAAQLVAANVGVTLQLIAQPAATRDLNLSVRVREAALAGVVAATPAAERPGSTTTRVTAAIALSAALEQDASGLSAGERALLHELLARLSRVDRPLDAPAGSQITPQKVPCEK